MNLKNNYCIKAANASTEFEKMNNKLKKIYLQKYISLFNTLASKINGNKG